MPSSCGSNGPITAGAASALSVASPRSNLRYSRQTFKPPDTYTLESETKPSAAPFVQVVSVTGHYVVALHVRARSLVAVPPVTTQHQR